MGDLYEKYATGKNTYAFKDQLTCVHNHYLISALIRAHTNTDRHGQYAHFHFRWVNQKQIFGIFGIFTNVYVCVLLQ